VEPSAARELFASARVARLATVGPAGRPHLVPVCFALEGEVAYSAVDAKPKRTQRLQRLANVRAEPRVAVLADRYDEDWTQLWWARADGVARVLEPGEPLHAGAVELLVARYAQYREQRPQGPVLAVTVERWTGWRPTWHAREP
jgi:PPOX class probable F420-dependent enzyme